MNSEWHYLISAENVFIYVVNKSNKFQGHLAINFMPTSDLTKFPLNTDETFLPAVTNVYCRYENLAGTNNQPGREF